MDLLDKIKKEQALKMENIGKTIDCLDKGFVRLVDFMGDDTAIVQAARTSTGAGEKTPEEDEKLIRHLLRNRHTSPFEFVEFKFHIKAPILTFRQLIRHRTASCNEASGRFMQLPSEAYMPNKDRLMKQSTMNKQGSSQEPVEVPDYILKTMKDEQDSIFKNYEEFISFDLTRELARNNLPVSTYSQMYWKIDLHNLFNTLRLRMDHHAQEEIRVYANAMFELIKPIVPMALKAFEDYSLKAKNFSRMELELLKDLLGEVNEDMVNKIKKSSLSKREQREFFDKIK
jgi:thymidylate synthase (FAD)